MFSQRVKYLTLTILMLLQGCTVMIREPTVAANGPVAVSGEKVWVDLTFDELKQQCYNSTSAQFSLFTRELRGKYIRLEGAISNVSLVGDTRFQVFIDMGSKYSYGFLDESNTAFLSSQHAPLALAELVKGDKVNYEGRINFVSNWDDIYGYQCVLHLDDWRVSRNV
ncbi:hypothetical protein [Bowmanella dokdonensis]|uniref:Lipoprotein n=1 Tax=Bowmanella dokdonensis TaxID=751969 RepID=A0A939DMZ3_9ALTE|nr:hypothetical protein [Bowmanella dokdonensis]MBN7824766.1 hypothetical protein [Bowmanella dokdonensis]